MNMKTRPTHNDCLPVSVDDLAFGGAELCRRASGSVRICRQKSHRLGRHGR